MKSVCRMWAVVAWITALMNALGLALCAPGASNAARPSVISLAKVMQIARSYVVKHSTWAKEAVYDRPKYINNEWLMVVTPKSFRDKAMFDGPEHLIVMDRFGRVIHYYRAQ